MSQAQLPKLAPGISLDACTSAVWKYKAIYRLNNEQVGQWSEIASISVMS